MVSIECSTILVSPRSSSVGANASPSCNSSSTSFLFCVPLIASPIFSCSRNNFFPSSLSNWHTLMLAWDSSFQWESSWANTSAGSILPICDYFLMRTGILPLLVRGITTPLPLFHSCSGKSHCSVTRTSLGSQLHTNSIWVVWNSPYPLLLKHTYFLV